MKKENNIFRGILNGQKGQILAVSALTALSLVMFWIVLVNMGMLVRNRVQVTNAVDNAAQTAATMRARGLNKLGYWGTVVAGLLSSVPPILSPAFVWYPDVQIRPPFGWHTSTRLASQVRSAVEGLTHGVMPGINRTYGGELAFLAARSVARASGADNVAATPGSFSLQLEPNLGPNRYYGTTTITWTTKAGVQYVFFPSWWRYLRGRDYPNSRRWYQMRGQSRNNFRRKRQEWVAWKDSEPFFGGDLMGIDNIRKTSAVAASRPYNRDSAMFLERDHGDWLVTWRPIWEYFRAWRGGWEAQLIPARPLGIAVEH